MTIHPFIYQWLCYSFTAMFCLGCTFVYAVHWLTVSRSQGAYAVMLVTGILMIFSTLCFAGGLIAIGLQ